MPALLLTLWLLHVAALAVPGPNVLLVSHLAATGDRRAAACAAAGVALGAGAWSCAAVLGAGTLLPDGSRARFVLQAAGGAYLVRVAAGMWRSRRRRPREADRPGTRRAFRSGLLTNLSNPKAALFFASIFASVLPRDPSPALMLASVSLVVANALGWHLLLAVVLSSRWCPVPGVAWRSAIARIAAASVGAFGVSFIAGALSGVRNSMEAVR